MRPRRYSSLTRAAFPYRLDSYLVISSASARGGCDYHDESGDVCGGDEMAGVRDDRRRAKEVRNLSADGAGGGG